MPNNDTSTDELIAIVNQFGTWQNLNDAQLVYIEQAIQAWSDRRVAEANSQGHWFTYEKQLDAYWNFAYFCRCGYKASSRRAIDGHVEWKKSEMLAALKKEDQKHE